MDSTPIRPGEVLADRYVVERVLGSGGMGVVVSAVHRTLGERVAIKFLLDSSRMDAVVVERFLREARATARLRSEHAVRVTDVGTLGNGAPYMVMEFLEGNDAAYEVDCRGPLPVAEAIDYVLQACEALAEAHALGIVHRDLKPANIFLTERPGGFRVVKVIDFGIAKSAEAPSSLTTTASTIGSPMYMSPEQIRNAKNVDPRSDVWSLGVTCYELLTARLPFSADSLHGTLASIIADHPVPLREARPDLPERLEAALAPCFEKDRKERYEDIAELARALAPFGGEQAAEHVYKIESVLRAAPGPAKLVPKANDDVATLVDPPLTAAGGTPTVVERVVAATVRSPEARTVAPWTQTSLPPKRRLGPVVFWGGAGVAAVIAAAAVLVARARPEHVELRAPSSASPAVVSNMPPSPVITTSLAPSPTSPASSATAPASSTTKPTSAPPPRAPARMKPRPKPAASASAAPAGPVTIEGRKF